MYEYAVTEVPRELHVEADTIVMLGTTTFVVLIGVPVI